MHGIGLTCILNYQPHSCSPFGLRLTPATHYRHTTTTTNTTHIYTPWWCRHPVIQHAMTICVPYSTQHRHHIITDPAKLDDVGLWIRD